ncbi:MAG: Do family serine endopeptidase [Candidatus Omnitrophica bacterium]|nr:Do family serine endopeptidase [Candidatus Omnitrophota bacterium]
MRLGFLIALLGIFFSVSAYSQSHLDIEKYTIAVAEDAGKAVVSISSIVKSKTRSGLGLNLPAGQDEDIFQRFFEEFFGEYPQREYRRMGLGSGVIITKDGYILTNEHVITGATEVFVKLADGREFKAEIQGVDPLNDLAVIKIEADNLPFAKLGDSSNLKIGSWVMAIGNPFGFAIDNPEPSATVGVVSALHRYLPALGRRQRTYDDLIQTDAAINPGNSGGPLVDLDGDVIGINTAIITTSGGYQGLGFAIPVNKAKEIIKKLIKGEKIYYGWLGVSIQDLNDDLRNYFGLKEKEGVVVVRVLKDSPAEESGFKEGDLVVSFANKLVVTAKDFIRRVSSSEVGSQVSASIIREGKTLDLTVKIGKQTKESEDGNADPRVSFRGMIVDNISQQHQESFNLKNDQGVVVIYLEPNSLAGLSGLKVGDQILKLENKPIKNKEDFASVSAEVKGNCLIKAKRGYYVVKGSK